MTIEVLNQLRTLRESIAEALRKDPRYLTLASLDKSISEISGVLQSVGVDVPPAAQAAPLQFEGGAASGNGAEPHGGNGDPVPFRKGRRKPNLDEVGAPASSTDESLGAAPVAPWDDKMAPATQTEVHDDVGLTQVDTRAPVEPGAEEVAAPADAPSEPSAAQPLMDTPAAESHSEQPELESAAPTASHDATPPEVAAIDEPTDQVDANHAEPDQTDHASPEPIEPAHLEADHAGNGAAIPDGKASGYMAMAPKPGAAQYQPAMSVKFGKLPNKVDLRPLMTPIEDQGDTNSCVANAVAGAYEYWIRKASKQQHDISRLFVYYNARWRDGSQEADDGSVIQLAMEGLAKFGACSDTTWPFDAELVTRKPGADAYQDAAPFKVHDMAQVPVKLDSWKQALAEGKPIVFGCLLFESFDDCTRHGGVVPMPAPDELPHAAHGGHAMCAVGYSDSEKVFIVRNSWGPDWGDHGYCYMPYAYLMSEKFNDGDCWVFVPKVPSQPPREVWSDDTGPVTNGGHGVDFPIEPHSVDDYRQVPVDFFDTIRKPFNGTAPADYASYVSLASKAQWSEMEPFDYRTVVGSTATMAGTAAVAAALSGLGDDDADWDSKF